MRFGTSRRISRTLLALVDSLLIGLTIVLGILARGALPFLGRANDIGEVAATAVHNVEENVLLVEADAGLGVGGLAHDRLEGQARGGADVEGFDGAQRAIFAQAVAGQHRRLRAIARLRDDVVTAQHAHQRRRRRHR